MLFSPHFVTDWLTLPLRIREVQSSNLGPETGYTEVFCSFSQSVQENSEIGTLNYATIAVFHIISNSSFAYETPLIWSLNGKCHYYNQ
jgi:hypothetical protein